MPSLLCLVLRLVNSGREWTRCPPIQRWMSNACRYVRHISICVLSKSCISCMCVLVLRGVPWLSAVVSSSTFEMSAASCFLISCSSSLSAIVVDNRFSPAIFVVDNRFCSAIFRVNNRVIVGRRRVRISYCSERTRARSLWGGMSFICSAATSLYFRSFGGISVSMFRHNSSEHSRSLVVASVSGSLPS